MLLQTDWPHSARCRQLIVHLVNKFPTFLEPTVSASCSQYPATGTPNRNCPTYMSCFSKFQFSIFLPSRQYLASVLVPWVLRNKMICAFASHGSCLPNITLLVRTCKRICNAVLKSNSRDSSGYDTDDRGIVVRFPGETVVSFPFPNVWTVAHSSSYTRGKGFFFPRS